MNLIERIKSFFAPEVPVEVYCQACGRHITNEGGDVSDSGKIYCHGFKEDGESRCLDSELILFEGIIEFEYLNAKQVQRGIQRTRITGYSRPKETDED